MKGFLFSILFLVSVSLFSQIEKDMSLWDDICYCESNGLHPSKVLHADNNLEILYYLRDGKTLDELAAVGVQFSRSQILLLLSQKLISRSDNTYRTSIPFLEGSEALGIRTQSQLLAEKIVDYIKNDCLRFVDNLSNNGMGRNAFAIFSSYVVDGLVWEKMEQSNLIHAMQKGNIWDGSYWLIEPRREFSYGTNSYSKDGKNVLNVCWTQPLVTSKMIDGLFVKENIEALRSLIDNDVPITDDKVLEKWSYYDVLTTDGRLNIPVIKEKQGDTIYDLSNIIVSKIIEAFSKNLDVEKIKQEFGFKDNGEAVIVFYHEVMWDLLERLIMQQVIEVPSVLREVTDDNVSQVRDVMFVTRK